MLIAFAVGGMILAGIISIPVLIFMTGENAAYVTENFQELISSPQYFREMQVVQSFSAIFGFLVPALFAAYLLSTKPVSLTGFKGHITARQLGLVVVITILAISISSALGYLSYQLPFPETWKAFFENMEDEYAEMAAKLINLNNIPELIISVIVLALVPAICEEAFFRGGLQNFLYRGTGKNWMAIIVVSLIFSAIHFSVYGFLSRFVLSIILGFIFHYSGRLWLSILAHFINNAAAVLMIYFQKNNGKTMEEVMSDKSGSYLGLLAIPIVIYLFIIFRKNTSQPTTITNGI